MKVLVIDDKNSNLLSAEKTLGADHEITVVGSVDEFFQLHEDQSNSGQAYWDAVLCDLHMPNMKYWDKDSQETSAGINLPVGLALAICAATGGARYVAVASDTSHHGNATAWYMHSADNKIFTIANANVYLTENVSFVDLDGGDKGKDWAKVLKNAMKEVGDKVR